LQQYLSYPYYQLVPILPFLPLNNIEQGQEQPHEEEFVVEQENVVAGTETVEEGSWW
jgi:hypothetical protein